MIKKGRTWSRLPFAVWPCVIALACTAPDDSTGRAPWQGVVEFEARTLAFEVFGRVQGVGVSEGDTVEAGAPLARLDATLEVLSQQARTAEARAVRAELELVEAGSRPEDVRSLRASLASARATEALAGQSAARTERLRGQGAATEAAFDEANARLTTSRARRRELEAQMARLRQGARTQERDAAFARFEASQAAVRLSEERVARHELVAVNPGMVLDIHIERGEFVQIGAPVATLADITRPYVDIFVPQADIGQITIGQRVSVQTDARAAPYGAVVETLAQQTEYTPRFLFSERERPDLVIRVRVRVEAPKGTLHAGVPAFVSPTEGST